MRKQTSLDLHRLKVNSNLTQTLLVKALDSPRVSPPALAFCFCVLFLHPDPKSAAICEHKTKKLERRKPCPHKQNL